MNYLNALNNPAGIAQGVQQSFLAGREYRADNESRNALAALVTNPDDSAAMGTLAQYNPQAAMQMQERQQQMAAQQAQKQDAERKARMEQMGTMRQLLDQAGQNPMQAFQAAQQLGIDTTQIPQPGTSEFEPWRQQQLFILGALEKEGDNLPGLAEEVMLALPQDQRDVNSPAFKQAFTAALENKYAAEYTDAQGNTRRRAIIGDPSRATIKPRESRPQLTDAELENWAAEAVRGGADKVSVFRQLQEWGVKPMFVRPDAQGAKPQ